MSTGFSVLVIGSLLAPIVARVAPAIGGILLTAVAIASFAVAAFNQGTSQAPARQGATAAVGTYALILPLVYLAWHRLDAAEIGLTALTAAVVGALAGHVAAYRHRVGANA
jgi:hypothetical protein